METSDDAFLGGRLRLLQPVRGHRSGHDALLLAASTAAKSGDRVVEFGAGVGAAGLVLAARVPAIALTLIERDAAIAELARDNAARNGIAADVATLDLTSGPDALAAIGMAPQSIDAVLMNPPFNAAAHHRASPNPARRDAHVADDRLLLQWLDAAHHLLKPEGSVTLIWRADGLKEVLIALDHGFGSIALQPVHAAPDKPAIRVLTRAVKGGRAPLLICPPLVLSHDFQDKAAALTPLPLARL